MENKIRNNMYQQRQGWESILEYIPSGLVCIDQRGIVTQFNKASKKLMPSLATGEKWTSLIEKYFSPKEDDGYEVSMVDGRRLSIHISSLPNHDGELITMTDLTITRAYQAQRSSHDRYTMMGRMLSHLAHQIRTPLTSAKLYLKNLSHPLIKDEKRDIYYEKINYCHQSIEHQINNLLTFAKGGNSIVCEFSTKQLIETIEKNSEASLSQQHVSIRVKNDVPDHLILGNIDALSSAINNIIDNSIQANAKSVVMNCQEINKMILITIIDDGDGMKQATVSKLFEPFYTTKAKGTGLGMAVLDAVIRAHHGKIDVLSSLGGGSQFKLFLPYNETVSSTN